MQRFNEDQEEIIHELVQAYVEGNPDCDYKYKALLAKWKVPLCAICNAELKKDSDVAGESRGGKLCKLCVSELKTNK